MPQPHWLSTFGFAPLGEGAEASMTNWVTGAFQFRALTNHETYFHNYFTGTCKTSFEELSQALLKDGAQEIVRSPATKRDEGKEASFLFENCFVAIDWTKDENRYNVHLLSLNRERHDKYVKYFDDLLDPISSKGRIYMLRKTDHGFMLQSMGIAGMALSKENYTQEVVRDFQHIVEDFANKSPCGRLSILEGEPGTGKTYLIRGMIDAAPDSLFVLIPPSLIQDLSSPEFVPALSELKTSEESAGPTVLIFEDADSILVERQASNMGSISSCLNLSDGIIGNILDIRIIASTNSKKVEMDEAILRDGRLCRYMYIGPLGNTQAHQVYERLTGKKIDPKNDPLTDKEHTLAEVYKKARMVGKLPEDLNNLGVHNRPRKRRAGFRGSSPPRGY